MNDAIGTGIKRGGRIEWDDASGFTDELQMMKDGSVIVRVELATPKVIRTLKLLRYYFGHVIRLMAEDQQVDKDYMHDLMCDRFLKHTVHIVNKRTGEMHEREVAGRSSKLTSDEFWEFILKVRLFAAEFLNIETRDPDPAWREHEKDAA